MARYTGPATRVSRRLRVDLVGGDMAFERRPYPPGQAGRNRIKESEYLLQLQEKQKAKYTYGVLERQFRVLLESRLDNVIYRAGLANTRRQARQLVSHGHFTVNGKKINVPSFRVTQYDIIDVRERSQKMEWFEEAQDRLVDANVPAWLQVVPDTLRILVHQLPERAQIDVPLQEQLIVELYSK